MYLGDTTKPIATMYQLGGFMPHVLLFLHLKNGHSDNACLMEPLQGLTG